MFKKEANKSFDTGQSTNIQEQGNKSKSHS